MITINIEKAQEIQRNRLRAARKSFFEQLDTEFMMALEQGDEEKQREISRKKKKLRDITQIKLPEQISEIKAICPKLLNELKKHIVDAKMRMF